jgi:hypothetical protein
MLLYYFVFLLLIGSSSVDLWPRDGRGYFNSIHNHAFIIHLTNSMYTGNKMGAFMTNELLVHLRAGH